MEAVQAAMDRVRASVEGLEIKHLRAQRPFLTVKRLGPLGRARPIREPAGLGPVDLPR